MCGICGAISKNKFDSSVIAEMSNVISHRGPDSDGFLFSRNININCETSKIDLIDSEYFIGFAHRRLAIVDLSPTGHQPMSYLNRYWIVYNGEVYNFKEIKSELIIQGYEFISNNDTEVILAAFDFWGGECFNKFNGMWAFLIIDLFTNRIIISRDRFGIKPLYYYQDEENFVFSSEIKSILQFPNVKTSLNKNFVKEYLFSGTKEYVSETAFENIYRFNVSSYIDIDINEIFNEFSPRKYWELKPNINDEKFDQLKALEYAEKYYEILKDAVEVRLRADVKVGSASSGGLDSSSIVYLINQILKEKNSVEKQVTFSTVYKSPGTESCDESFFIDRITDSLDVLSYKIEPNVKDIPREHESLVNAVENPPDNTLMSSWHTFKLVGKSDVTVTLDGQGADEQLAGYLPYIIIYCANLHFSELWKESLAFNKTGASKYAIIGLLLNLSKRLIGRKISNLIYSTLVGRKVNVYQNLNQRLLHDTYTHLITLLHYADHTSMAFSIESRMPFMDYRLMEFLASLPPCYKIHDGWTKYIARLAFDKKLPDSITWRKDKMGWPIPEKKWFEEDLSIWYNDNLKLGRDFVSQKLAVKDSSKLKEIRLLNIAVFSKIFSKYF